MVSDEIVFYGHPNVLATHTRTIEITKDDFLTKRGDCIIGINANKACNDLDHRLKKRIQKDETLIQLEIIIENLKYKINGIGKSTLTLENKHHTIIRTTSFVCPRTISIKSDKASNQIPREMICMLRNKDTKGFLVISVED